MRAFSFVKILFIAMSLALLYSAPSYAENSKSENETSQSTKDYAAQLIQQKRLLIKYREFEYITRHTHFLMSNAILAVYGGWNVPDQGQAYVDSTEVDTFTGVIGAFARPEVHQLKLWIDRSNFISEDDARTLRESIFVFEEVMELCIGIGKLLNKNDPDQANMIYREKVMPLFKDIWRTNYTLISETERRL